MSAVPLIEVTPSVVFAAPNKSDIPENSEDRICSICLETMQNMPENPTIGHMSGNVPHLFDQKCIESAFTVKVACPLCRAIVENAAEFADPQVVAALAQQERAARALAISINVAPGRFEEIQREEAERDTSLMLRIGCVAICVTASVVFTAFLLESIRS